MSMIRFNGMLLEKLPNLHRAFKQIYYSVTQSYSNSFGGDVVLDTFNNVSRDTDNILEQIYKKQICPDFYYDDFLIP